jgi:hypothetical protein
MDFLEKLVAKKFNVFLFLALITILVYSPVMRGDYVFDDDIFIVNNQYVHDLNHVKQIYTHSTTDGAGVSGGNFYRPNQSLSHAVIYSLVGISATPQHLFSILIHLLNVCLLFMFLSLLGFSNLSSLIAAAVFAVHPINTEAVSYISGLSDPLSLMFILFSCIFYISYKKEKKIYYAVFTIICVLLALFTKESSAMLMIVLFLLEIYLQPKKIKIGIPEKLILSTVAILCVGFLILKFTVFNFTGNLGLTSADNEYTQSLWVRFITFCTIFPRYMGMLVFPVSQYMEKPYSAYISFEALGFGGLMMLGAFVYLFYNSLKSNRSLMLGIGIFFAFLLPVSGIIPTNAIYLEHWLYLPFLGVALLIALLFQNADTKNKTTILILFGVMITVYSIKTIYRNNQWADAVKFYKNEIKFNKKSARIYNNLAMVLNNKKDYFSAINYYGQAISVYDVYPQTHHNLAQTYLQLNQISNAIAEEYKALQMQPNFMYSLKSLYNIYTGLNDEKRAAHFAQFIQQAEQGQMPDWNEIKANLSADTK